MNPDVDFYFDKAEKWEEELRELRGILLDSGMTEELKWGVPCYTVEGANVILIHYFREYCALAFFKGVLMKDPEEMLIQTTENVQSTRHLRFTGVTEIREQRSIISSYLKEAVEIEKAGLKVKYKKTDEYHVPEEFQQRLDEDADLKAAFESLTPGRQRGYLLHFAQPKRSTTRQSRIEKCAPRIFEGKGLNDR